MGTTGIRHVPKEQEYEGRTAAEDDETRGSAEGFVSGTLTAAGGAPAPATLERTGGGSSEDVDVLASEDEDVTAAGFLSSTGLSLVVTSFLCFLVKIGLCDNNMSSSSSELSSDKSISKSLLLMAICREMLETRITSDQLG